MPAQFYPECAQITITGGGTLEPTSAQLVSFPGAYKASDPGGTYFMNHIRDQKASCIVISQ